MSSLNIPAKSETPSESPSLSISSPKAKKVFQDQHVFINQLRTEANISFLFGSFLLLLWTGYLSGLHNFSFLKLFFNLSYRSNHNPDIFYNGYDDIYFIIQLTLHLIFLRASFAKYVGLPLSQFLKINAIGTQIRFSEQLWGVFLSTYAFSFGSVLIYLYPQFLRFNTAWATYPLLEQPTLVKIYYLHQISFWLCSALYLFVEKRRSDFFAMILHHSGTLFLMIGSYFTNFQAMGIIIHFIMDFSDICLPFTKILHYLKLEDICNISFVFTAITWILTRQFGLIRVIYSAAFEAHHYRPYEFNPKNGVYATKTLQYSFVGILVMLEILCLYWLSSIIRLITDVIYGRTIRDVRSDEDE
ncbi:hypothetical protein BB561_002526 [Smittium simulii]|uniref:TLC domain-containing protein n=1 Tax=Smittium simulii TaxID=133385 RepID=A0A2T9YQ38_9FUNG|nr:hypothetical protein BB561_002526 [Smittium simulii]